MLDFIPYCFVKECNWLPNRSVSVANLDLCSCLYCLRGSKTPGQQRRMQMDRDWFPRGSLPIPLKLLVKISIEDHGQTPSQLRIVTETKSEFNQNLIDLLFE